MVNLTDRHSADPPEVDADRPTFRRQLLATVGPALAASIGGLALIAWIAASWSFHHNAVETLEAEISEMQAEVVVGDSLTASGYAWNEVHHRLVVDRVDPIFIQLFDGTNALLRQSTNVDSMGAGYPDRLLDGRPTSYLVPTLQTFEVGGRTLYYRTAEVRGPGGEAVGVVQVARYVPGHWATLRQYGIGLAILSILLTGGLLALVGWAARRVLAPLRSITDVARTVTSADLTARVDVPPKADRETATLGRALNALLDRIQTHVEALRAFTSNAAHELQTPLTVLRGHVEISLRRERTAEDYRETLRLLDDRLGELVRTLRALLTLTRLDRGGVLDTERVDLAEIAKDEVEAFRAQAEASGLELSIASEPGAWVDGQPELLREAVRNLVDNALKYTPDGRVDVAVEHAGDAVRLVCTDTGLGIDEADLPKVSDRFFRSSNAAETGTEGSGLGLAIVARIVDRHGGRLHADSTAGEGTRFVIELPAVSAPQTASTQRNAPSSA